jgi:transposase
MPCKTDAVVARTIGIDTGKNTLHLIGLDEKGAIVLREKLSRGRIAARLANVPRCLIGIEAGMATHYVARELIALGHEVKQVPPAYARPFRQGHKNDFRDAHAIAEAVQRPSTRCVPVKTDDQLDLQALHRVRSRLIGERTAVINQIRSFLLERGIPVRQGIRFLRPLRTPVGTWVSDCPILLRFKIGNRLKSNCGIDRSTPLGDMSRVTVTALSRFI